MSPVAFRINDLHVDPGTGLVSGPLGRVRLEPRVLAVLQALADRPGAPISRSDLLSGIWPGGEVYDDALTQCIYQLRQQLVTAGGAGCRGIVRTIPKRGYLLDATVKAVPPKAADEPEAAPPQRRDWRPFAGVLAVVMLLGASWSALDGRGGTNGAAPSPRTEILAVLPFLPLVEGERDPVLEFGLADTLITRLSGMEQIIVRPMSSVRQYADMHRDAARAGRELGADVVIEGTLQRAGQGLRVTARLLRASDGAALWAGSFQDQSSSLFAVQDAICERIAAALAQEFGQETQPRPARLGTADAEAYGHYLEGRHSFARFTLADMRSSIEHFRRAVSRDPDYAHAWLGLANVQFRIPIAGEAPPGDFYPLASEAALRALEIDPTLAEGHAILGWIAHWYDRDWAASEAHFRRAIELNPHDTEGHLGYAHLLSSTGRHPQALAEVRRAREISPFFLLAASLEGSFLTRARRPSEAIERLETARRLNENFWLVRLHLSEAYAAAGRHEDALREAQGARQVSGGSTIATAREIAGLAATGRTAEAEALLTDLLQRADERYVPPYDLALAHEGVGNPDAALALLERAYRERDPKMSLLGVDAWHSLRARPEFASLMQRMRLSE
jgi:TolB-like protein/DNA-binding winged helix-turn-helix (wHTH) protein/Flp pilus assembly protein TadD